MTSISKRITEEGLKQDFEYLIRGIDVHYVLADISSPREGLEVLEPGCGSGKLGIWYARRGCRVTLLDIDKGALDYARALLYEAPDDGADPFVLDRVSFDQGSIHDLPYEEGSFDFVFNEGVPHHWPDDLGRQTAIDEMARVTRPGGKVAVVGSNAHCPDTMGMAYATYHTYTGMPPKQRPFTRSELKRRLERAGLQRVFVSPVSSWPTLWPGSDWMTSRWSTSPLLVGYGTKP